jgi:hypothetical protein
MLIFSTLKQVTQVLTTALQKVKIAVSVKNRLKLLKQRKQNTFQNEDLFYSVARWYTYIDTRV